MASLAPSSVPAYGHRIISSLIDDLARETPHRCFCSLPRTTRIEDGFRDITYGVLANAINRIAWWIQEKLGRNEDFETLAYVGPPDLRYIVVTIAAQKTGYKASGPKASLHRSLTLS